MDDRELLTTFSKTRSEAAFRNLVERHLGWVYSVALRKVGSSALAEDVAQSVFILLARKAGDLRSETNLSGWLFRTTRFVANRALRSEMRRASRERTAAQMISSSFESTRPFPDELMHVDEAVAALSESDRAAILLRFYERKSLREIGERLGLSDEAAKKRVRRAVDKMRVFFERRGIQITGPALAGILAERVVHALPSGIMAAISTTAAAETATSGLAAELVSGVLSAWRWTKLKFAAGAGAAAILLLLLLRPLLAPSANNQVDSFNEAGIREPQVLSTQSSTAPDALRKPDAQGLLLQVVAADSGLGIAHARVPVSYVVVDQWVRSEFSTDQSGFCSVTLPQRFSRLDIGALKDDFVQKFYTWREDSDTPLPASYTLRLEIAATIGGRVHDPAGRPVSGAEVGLIFGTSDTTFLEPTPERLGFVGEPLTATKTDAQGNWRCALTPAGFSAFRIQVKHPSFVDGTFYPTAELKSSSGPSWIRFEEVQAGTAIMILRPGHELRGVVLNDTGEPVADAKVTAMGMHGYRQDGVKTLADGSFRLSSLPAGASQICASAKGFAPLTLSIEVRSPVQDAIFQLKRGAPRAVRIVDNHGVGISGAWATIQLPIAHNVDFSVETDAGGRARFEGIPTNALSGLLFHAGAKGFFISRNLTLNAEEPEPVIRLMPSLRVVGTVLDEQTRLPILNFKAIPCSGHDSSGYNRAERKLGDGGAYSVFFSEPGPPFRVRIEAEGYETAMSPPMGYSPSDRVQDFMLRRIDPEHFIRGTVLGTDGMPFPNITVALLTFEQGANFRSGKLQRDHGEIMAKTDANGQFAFEPNPQAHSIVAADPIGGFRMVRMHRATAPFEIQLQPWGRVEGRLTLKGEPAPDQKLFIRKGPITHRSVEDGLYSAFDLLTTDAEGRFAAGMLPPGDITLYLHHGMGESLTHATPAEIRAGETTNVQMTWQGSRITGKLAMSNESEVNWKTQLISASLLSRREPPAIQPPPDSRDFAARLRLLDFFDESEEWHAFERAAKSFPVEVRHDGSFVVEAVPSGSYEFSIRISETAANNRDHQLILGRRISASAKEDIIVPENAGESPVDLGTILLRPAGSKTR